MNIAMKHVFDAEMAEARRLYQAGDMGAAFRHLECAHVLGQRAVVPHIRTHWFMLKIGWRRGLPSEMFGQAMRIVLGALGSAIGVVPTGNTGGTNISIFQRLPIAPDITRHIDATAPAKKSDNQ